MRVKPAAVFNVPFDSLFILVPSSRHTDCRQRPVAQDEGAVAWRALWSLQWPPDDQALLEFGISSADNKEPTSRDCRRYQSGGSSKPETARTCPSLRKTVSEWTRPVPSYNGWRRSPTPVGGLDGGNPSARSASGTVANPFAIAAVHERTTATPSTDSGRARKRRLHLLPSKRSHRSAPTARSAMAGPYLVKASSIVAPRRSRTSGAKTPSASLSCCDMRGSKGAAGQHRKPPTLPSRSVAGSIVSRPSSRPGSGTSKVRVTRLTPTSTSAAPSALRSARFRSHTPHLPS